MGEIIRFADLIAAKNCEDFDRFGNEPLLWAHSASSLLTSASALRRQLGDQPTAIELINSVLLDPLLMLRGFGVECLLKTILLKSGTKLYRDGKLQKPIEGNPHDLTNLASAAGVELDETDFASVLRKLTVYSTYCGRYPLPTDIRKDGAGPLWEFAIDEPRFERLMRKLVDGLGLEATLFKGLLR